MSGVESQQQQQQQEPQGSRGCCGGLNPAPNELPMPELTAEEERIYKQLQRIAFVMDDAVTIPCTNGRSIGLDPVVGLVPFVGDFAGAIVSCVLVARASRHVSKYTATRMLINVAIDASIGTIPILGDIFDVGWQANTRNVAIFENHMKRGAERQRDVDQMYVWSLVIIFVLFCLIMMIGFVALIVVLIMLLTGNLG